MNFYDRANWKLEAMDKRRVIIKKSVKNNERGKELSLCLQGSFEML